MKSLLIIVVLVAVAVAAGGSFILRAGAQPAPSATLDVACRPAAAPVGVDTLLQCRLVATNTGDLMIDNARIDLVPAPGLPVPDRYLFFAAALDGAPFAGSGRRQATGWARSRPAGSGRWSST